MSVPIDDLNQIKCNPAVLRLYSSRTKLEKRGKDYFGSCPLVAEKTPSFTVSQDNRGFWLYHCFSCGAGGDPIKFIQELDKCSFNQAVKTVQDFLGSDPQKAHVDKVFKPLEEKPKEYKTFSLAEYKKLEDAFQTSSEAVGWLQKRGVSLDAAKALRWGFRQDIGRIGEKSIKNHAAIKDKGWIAFPYLQGETVVTIKYRSVVEKTTTRQPGMATVLYNTDDIDVFEPIFLVEGEPDAGIMKMAGYPVVGLPMAGYSLTPEMRDLLSQADSIMLAGDNDGKVGVKAMERLKADFGDKALHLIWPEGCKDANDAFLKHAKRDLSIFRTTVEEMIGRARSQPMKGVYSLADTMMSSDKTPLIDHPNRLRFPWKSVDEMAINLPGAVVFSTSTQTGQGKTIFWMNQSLYEARKHNEVILNYQCELDPHEFSCAAAAHLTMQDRNNLSPEDYKKAGVLLRGVRYYIGSDPTLTSSNEALDLIEEAIKRLGITRVILDHLHYLCGQDTDPIQAQNRAMQRIKNMAMIYGVIFTVLGQPRKADQKGKGKELHITDVKGAGSIPDNANSVYFLHREVIKNIDPANPPMDEYEPETSVRNKKARSKGKGAAYARLMYLGSQASFLETDISHEDGLTKEDLFQ